MCFQRKIALDQVIQAGEILFKTIAIGEKELNSAGKKGRKT